MSNKTKPKPRGPRTMWAVYPGNSKQWLTGHKTKAEAECYRWSNTSDEIHRVAVISLSDVEAFVERAAKVMYVNARRCDKMAGPYIWETTFQCVRDAYLNDARAALTAAGIPCKQRRARK